MGALTGHPGLVHGHQVLPQDLARGGLGDRLEELDPAGELLEVRHLRRHEGPDLLRCGLGGLHRGFEDDVGPRSLPSPSKKQVYLSNIAILIHELSRGESILIKLTCRLENGSVKTDSPLIWNSYDGNVHDILVRAQKILQLSRSDLKMRGY